MMAKSGPAGASAVVKGARIAPDDPRHAIVERLHEIVADACGLPEILDQFHRLACEAMDCDDMLVSTHDPRDDLVRCVYASIGGQRADLANFPPIKLAPEGSGMQSRVFRTGEPLRFDDMDEAMKHAAIAYHVDLDGTHRDSVPEEEPHTRSSIMVPIKSSGSVIGVLQLMSNRLAAYDDDDVATLELFARALCSAVVADLGRAESKRLEERTAELQAANEEMEGFTHTVSHDLRAPLRAMMSASMILVEDYGDKLDEEGKHELARMSNAAAKMGHLIDDLLQFSRLGRAEIAKRDVDLSAMIESIAEIVQSRYEHKVQVIVEPGLGAQGDPTLLTLAIENLIDNAFKYSSASSEATIRVGAKSLDGHPVFFIEDNGIGFEMQFVHKLFQPFERLHNESAYPGSGIGLANVKRIIERHGGKVWAESEHGKGATIYFTLG